MKARKERMIEDMRGVKRRLAIGVAVVMAVLAGCSGGKKDVVEAIRQAGILRVALVDSDNGFTALEGETPKGVEPELVNFIGQNLGVSVRFQVCEKEAALAAVENGEADIALGCISQSGALSERFLLTGVYGKGYCYVVTKKGDFVGTVGSLKNRAVGVDRNLDEVTKGALYSAEGISLMDMADVRKAEDELKGDIIQAYVCYEKQAKKLLAKEELQVQNLMNLEPEEYVIVAPNGSKELVDGMNVLIRQFLEDR